MQLYVVDAANGARELLLGDRWLRVDGAGHRRCDDGNSPTRAVANREAGGLSVITDEKLWALRQRASGVDLAGAVGRGGEVVEALVTSELRAWAKGLDGKKHVGGGLELDQLVRSSHDLHTAAAWRNFAGAGDDRRTHDGSADLEA